MKIFTKALTLLLSLLGFSTLSGCVMYGQPTAMYELDINVVDKETKTRIDDIKVTLKNKGRVINKTLTDDGYAKMVTDVFRANNYEFTVVVEDFDGDLNGSYQKDSVTVKVNKDEFKGGSGHWNDGSASSSVEIEMQKE